MSFIDQATGFLNRNGGFSHIANLSSRNTNVSLSFIWIALDRLKQINESFGHRGGDQVIAEISQRVRNLTDVNDKWCRIGGDEFVCILKNSDMSTARHLAFNLLNRIETPLAVGDILIHPSASIGIAVQERNEDPHSCLARADRAMSLAKNSGGGQIIVSHELQETGDNSIALAREELEVESQIHAALESNGLQLHYQPIIDFNGQLNGVEALMRCEVNGINVPPGKLIPVAEKTGLISRLGDWSMFIGCEFAQNLDQAEMPTKVAINVSRAQLMSPNFSQAMHSALICTGVRHELIELELTESLFMDVSDVVQKNLRAARDAGISLAIDDFGTGYSCLANLKDIPATKIKLDRAFVVVLPEDRRAFAVVKALTQLGKELGMTVVAEGVETQEQLDSLQEAGVHAIQGYFHARPMPEDLMIRWMKARQI